MKSGAEIYLTVLADPKPKRAIHRLKNGSLRSLITRLSQPHGEPPCEKRDLIHGLAMVEACDRWMRQKGKGSIL